MRDFVDAYAVLGVPPGSDHATLKAAHRALLRRWHPDLARDADRATATRRAQEINVAYALVRDPATRASYDRVRDAYLRRAQRAPAPERVPRQAAPFDAALAEQWSALVTTAGRWAGQWWRRNRAPLRRAALRARRAGLDVVGRVVWLATVAVWTALGFVVALALQRVTGVDGVVTPLTATLGGTALGSRRGLARRLALIGATTSPWRRRAELTAYAVFVVLALAVDARW